MSGFSLTPFVRENLTTRHPCGPDRTRCCQASVFVCRCAGVWLQPDTAPPACRRRRAIRAGPDRRATRRASIFGISGKAARLRSGSPCPMPDFPDVPDTARALGARMGPAPCPARRHSLPDPPVFVTKGDGCAACDHGDGGAGRAVHFACPPSAGRAVVPDRSPDAGRMPCGHPKAQEKPGIRRRH